MKANSVTADDTRATARHAVLTSPADRAVNADLAGRAEPLTRDERGRTEGGAGRARVLARIAQIVTYVFGIVYSLLAIRLVLALIAARSSNGFVRLIGTLTDPFYSMFRGIVASPRAGSYTLVLPIVIAILVYALLHLGITRLLRLLAHRNTEI